MTVPPRWPNDPEHSHWYIDRFRGLARDGVDLAGEARLVDAMLTRGSRVLDAGCGPGRVGAELAARGHQVVGVDVDPLLIEAAREDHPGPAWIVADLSTLDLPGLGQPDPFDAVVVAGNVMTFLGEGTEPSVLSHLLAHLKPDGFAVVGFGVDRGYALTQFDADLTAAGFTLEHRFATWDLRPFGPDADFAVSVLRRPPG